MLQFAPATQHIGTTIQYPRLQQPLRCALAFAYQRFELLTFITAQPHNILLYRNLLRSPFALFASPLSSKKGNCKRPQSMTGASSATTHLYSSSLAYERRLSSQSL